jgi:hypothetical protein
MILDNEEEQFVISTIIEHNYRWRKGDLGLHTDIHSDVWRHRLGNGYSKILKTLEDKGYIRICRVYLKTIHTFAYWIHSDFQRKQVTYIQSDRNKAKIIKDNSQLVNEVYSIKTMKFLESNLARLQPSDDLLSIEDTEIRKSIALRSAQNIQGGNMNLKKGKESNRLFHSFLECPSNFRRSFKVDGKYDLITIDIKSAHPFFCLKFYENNLPLKMPLKMPLNVVGEGTGSTYVSIHSTFTSHNGLPVFSKSDEKQRYYSILRKGIYEHFSKELNLSRDVVKLQFVKFLAGSVDNSVSKLFKIIFPWLWSYIVERDGKTISFALELQNLEAKIMIGNASETLRLLRSFFIPEHDGGSTYEKYLKQVTKVIMEAVKNEIGYYPILKITSHNIERNVEYTDNERINYDIKTENSTKETRPRMGKEGRCLPSEFESQCITRNLGLVTRMQKTDGKRASFRCSFDRNVLNRMKKVKVKTKPTAKENQEVSKRIRNKIKRAVKALSDTKDISFDKQYCFDDSIIEFEIGPCRGMQLEAITKWEDLQWYLDRRTHYENDLRVIREQVLKLKTSIFAKFQCLMPSVIG